MSRSRIEFTVLSRLGSFHFRTFGDTQLLLMTTTASSIAAWRTEKSPLLKGGLRLLAGDLPPDEPAAVHRLKRAWSRAMDGGKDLR
jgi:hypothetical protein